MGFFLGCTRLIYALCFKIAEKITNIHLFFSKFKMHFSSIKCQNNLLMNIFEKSNTEYSLCLLFYSQCETTAPVKQGHPDNIQPGKAKRKDPQGTET